MLPYFWKDYAIFSYIKLLKHDLIFKAFRDESVVALWDLHSLHREPEPFQSALRCAIKALTY